MTRQQLEATLPARQRPSALAQFVPLLQRVEQNFPTWVEVDLGGRKFDTIRTILTAAVKSWLEHEWDEPLSLEWFKVNWPSAGFRWAQGAAWIGTRTGELHDTAGTVRLSAHATNVLHVFQEPPTPEITEACCMLLNKEILTGEFRSAYPFPDVTKKYTNVEMFQPEGQPFWVLM